MVMYAPEYDLIFVNKELPEKLRPYAIVIPVINEGERIHSLLEKMKSISVSERFDIYVVDGGSTDGSLHPDAMYSYKVKSVILKKGPGKLSAQLLCAYHYLKDKRYTGIITIDGNDKDDPSTLDDFAKLIDEGYDFVQASRFVAGGVACRTPLLRTFAIRYIHAPCLSFASGFKWTDTTQGYRGYSSSFIFSDKVSIFRNVFKDYELLAYLNYIAPKSGFKCTEIGTSRIYPKGEVPTKISGIKGNFLLLLTLLNVCFGKYNKKCSGD